MSWNRCRALLGVALATLTAGLWSAPASAQEPLKVTYLCAHPWLNLEPWTVTLKSPLSGEWPRGRATGAVPVAAAVDLTRSTWIVMTSYDKMRSLEFRPGPGLPSGVGLQLEASPGLGLAPLAVQIPRVELPRRVAIVSLSGYTALPSFVPQATGEVEVKAGPLLLNIAGFAADGTPISSAGITVLDQDIDDDPHTYEVYCNPATSLDPIGDENGEPLPTGEMYADQDLRLVDLTVVDGPTAPEAPVVSDVGERSATLSFGSAITAPAGQGITRYEVLRGGVKIAQTSGHGDIDRGSQRTMQLGGLTPNTRYALSVVAIDEQGRRSNPAVVAPFTTEEWQTRTMALSGQAMLTKLTRNPLVLQGSLELSSERTTGEAQATIALQPARARLISLGMLPVTADIAFVRSSTAVGALVGGQLTLDQTFRVRVSQAYLYGSIPLAGGTTCQSKRLSTLRLRSAPSGFSFAAGGPLAATFDLSDLSGCGYLNGFASPLTASTDNWMTLQADAS